MVLLLAQNPKYPHNLEKPLEGTLSGRTVKAWLKMLGEPEVLIMNASRKIGPVTWKDYDGAAVSLALKECDRYVALGAYAAGLFERLGVACFQLPHPSGLNRKLNDVATLRHQLALCRLYIGDKG